MSGYIDATKKANKAKQGTFMKKMYNVYTDENGKVTKKVDVTPKSSGEGKLMKKQDTYQLPSSEKINNSKQTDEWMSVGKMIGKQ